MDNIKDKLIEIAKQIIINNADCSEISDDIITLDEFGYDHACEEIADSIIENLPELLADSEWAKLPCKVGDTVFFIVHFSSSKSDIKIKQRIVNLISLDNKGIILRSESNDFIDANVWGYIGETVFLTQAEADEKLAELKNK